jgi:hypothetical protein
MPHLSSTRSNVIAATVFCSIFAPNAYAEQRVSARSDDMREVLMTAGYSSLFGAAAGVALLPFLPGGFTGNLRVVAGGASVGFLAGSAFGFYSLSTQSRSYTDNYDYNPPNDETYSMDIERNGEPMSSLPAPTCRKKDVPANALVVGCGSQLSLNWPKPLLAPVGVAIPIVSVRF